MNLKKMQESMKEFARQRQWEKFHRPKNLATALTVEASELMEIFQWLTLEESDDIKNNEEKMNHIREEVADVTAYLIRFCEILEIDIEKAFFEKMQKNEKKYPVHLSKGNSLKYDQFSS